MTTVKLTNKIQQIPPAVRVLTIIALVGGLFFLRNYIGVVLFSALLALIFNPVYKWVLKKTHKQGIAISATLTSMAVAVVVPLFVVTALGVSQVSSFVQDVKESGLTVGTLSVDDVINLGTDGINNVLDTVPGGDSPPHVSTQQVKDAVQNAATEALQAVLSLLKSVGIGFFGFISTFIVAIFLIISMLRYQKELIELLRGLSPFNKEVMDMYLHRTVVMTKAMVKGQFVIAAAQGFAAAFSLWLVGIDYFWFFVIFLTFMSFIPLGAGIITIPIGVVLILTGNVWQGIYIIIWHMFVVSNIDNILRPRLVEVDARLDTALMMLAVFAGIGIFGPAGVVYGPVIMILIVSTLQLYREFNKDMPRIALPKKGKTTAKTKA